MGAAAVPRGGVHPGPALRQLQRQVGAPAAASSAAAAAGALLPEGALPVVDAPAALEPGVGLQAHAAAVPQGSALVEVSWRSGGQRISFRQSNPRFFNMQNMSKSIVDGNGRWKSAIKIKPRLVSSRKV